MAVRHAFMRGTGAHTVNTACKAVPSDNASSSFQPALAMIADSGGYERLHFGFDGGAVVQA